MADKPWKSPLWDSDDLTSAIKNLFTSEGDFPLGGVGPWQDGGALRKEEEVATPTGAPTNSIAAALSALDPETRALFESQLESKNQALGYQAVYQQLFPNGTPPMATPEQLGANPELLKLGTIDQTRDQFIEPSTGAIMLANGVMVDPSTGAITYPNDDGVPGSPLWLRKVNDWNESTIKEWRQKLRSLGFPVAKEGDVDAGFLEQIGSYYNLKYLYGGEIPLNAEGEAGLTDEGPKPREVFDPIEAEFSAKEALMTLFPGTTPDEKNVDFLKRRIMGAVRKALENEASPEHARLKGQKALDKALQNDPSAQLAQDAQQREQDENTDVSDALTNAFALLSDL
jgi:hypothetical protein